MTDMVHPRTARILADFRLAFKLVRMVHREAKQASCGKAEEDPGQDNLTGSIRPADKKSLQTYEQQDHEKRHQSDHRWPPSLMHSAMVAKHSAKFHFRSGQAANPNSSLTSSSPAIEPEKDRTYSSKRTYHQPGMPAFRVYPKPDQNRFVPEGHEAIYECSERNQHEYCT